MVDSLISESLEDFPEADSLDSAARHAAELTRANITDGTRGGHLRCVLRFSQARVPNKNKLLLLGCQNYPGLYCISSTT